MHEFAAALAPYPLFVPGFGILDGEGRVSTPSTSLGKGIGADIRMRAFLAAAWVSCQGFVFSAVGLIGSSTPDSTGCCFDPGW